MTGPRGRQSTINVVDRVLTRSSRCSSKCSTSIVPQLWQELWQYVENGGLGADRARGDGRCELLSWRRLDGPEAPKARKPKPD